MRKHLLAAALLLVSLGSWAFYPKTIEPQGYMMVIGRAGGSALNYEASVITITPDGQTTEQLVPFKGLSSSAILKSYTSICIAEVNKINQLKAEGWVIDQMTSTTNSNLYEHTYVLKRP